MIASIVHGKSVVCAQNNYDSSSYNRYYFLSLLAGEYSFSPQGTSHANLPPLHSYLNKYIALSILSCMLEQKSHTVFFLF